MADINIPKIGPVKKPVVIAVGVGAAALIGWRYWQSRSGGTAADVATTSDYLDPGTIPGVDGAVSSDNSYGSGGSVVDNTTSSYGFTGTTNDQWTQYATAQLQQSTDWSYTEIVSAIGNYLANKPLTTLQQQIVQSAIAAAGHPPVGSPVVIPGGDTPVLVAPTNLRASPTGSTTVRLDWTPVAGVNGYYIYRDGASTEVGAGLGTFATVSGLQPNTTYKFYVAAHSPAGKIGPRSSGVSVKTNPTSQPTVTTHETAVKH